MTTGRNLDDFYTEVMHALIEDGWSGIRAVDDPADAVKRVVAIYREQIEVVRSGSRGLYPGIAIGIDRGEFSTKDEAYGFVQRGFGIYTTTVTKPERFMWYLEDQLTRLALFHGVSFLVGKSDLAISDEFVCDDKELLCRVDPVSPRLVDEIARSVAERNGRYPLSFYSAPYVDEMFLRWNYYTGTDPSFIQDYVFLTNYPMYADWFINRAEALAAREPDHYALVMPESEVSRLRLEKARAARHELISKLRDANTSDGRDSFEAILAEFDALHERTEKDEVIVMDRRRTGQMPAYHLVCREGRGITLVNIGVGPSNAATLVECLMPARPRMVLMIGHCGGLRVDQKLGMYVLAEAYLRLDRVYDHLLHPSIPLQPSSEIQRGLREAIAEVHGRTDGGIKDLLQTGLVATTNFRTNEVHPDRSIPTLLRDSFALAQDMESGTMAAGCRMGRVPSGTLLMISDRPYHAGLKTARRTGEFYRKAVDAHMEIAFSFWKKIRENPESLASRKLRGAIDPPFR